MKLLAVYPCLPYPLDRGVHHRAYQLLRGLARSHDVALVALDSGAPAEERRARFEEFCERVEIIPFEHPPWAKLRSGRLTNPLPATIAHWTLPQVRPVLKSVIAAGSFDAIHLCDIVLAQYFLNGLSPLPLVADRTRVDLQYQWMEYRRLEKTFKTRLLHWENFVKLWKFERAVARRCFKQVVCGPDDAAFVRRFVSRRVPLMVLPNGVDLDYFNPALLSGEAKSPEPALLFCGAMDYAPNIDAVRWYFSEIHPALKARAPGLQIWIVGRDPGEDIRALRRLPEVTVTGSAPDVRPFYARAWGQIVPLRIGGGTRLKIVESMAMGAPVVSTRIGAQGLDLRHGHDVLFAETPREFVEQAAALLIDAGLRARLAENAMATARDRFSWTELSRRLSDDYSNWARSKAATCAGLAAATANE